MDSKIQNFFQLQKQKGLKMIHLNIRSLLKKIDQLRTILEGSNIEIFTLSETWLHSKVDTHMIQIQGYTAYRLDRETMNANLTTKRGGGLVTYVKNTSLDVYVKDAENTSTKDIEIQWFKIKRKNTKTITLANVYRPPNGNLDRAIKTIEKGLRALVQPNDETVILGDFNIDYKNKSSPKFKKIKFFERANALEQMICTTTRNSKTSSTILDMVFTNMKYIKEAGTLDSFLSDHQPIFLLKKKVKTTGRQEQQFEGRSYRHYNKQQFIDNVKAQKWDYFYDAADPMEAWDEMLGIINREANKQCPVRKYKIKHNKPCWLTNEILEQMKDRDYFYQKAKRTKSEDDWNIARFHRNQANFNVRRAKADYIKEQLKCNEGNGAKFWRIIKQVMPSKKGSRNTPPISICRNHDDAVEIDKVADFMNEYFVNLGVPKNNINSANHQNISKKVRALNTTPPLGSTSPITNGAESNDKLDFQKVTKREVETLIRKINVSKSSGVALLSSRLLKDSFQAVSDKLTYLFNLSITQGIFPTQWKKALVIPIPKVGNPKTAENYRPISLLPLPGKLLEKVIHSQLSCYLEDNDLLSDNQFGFRRQRSTSLAISQLLNQVYTNINKSAITAAIYIDFSKAFNCVQHATLIRKLSEFNLSKNIISWITSYLYGREQRTLANNVYSSYLPVGQGVPQGSVLGPLLYIIYANDIIKKIQNSGFTFYADDTVLYSKKKSLRLAQRELQEDLDGLSEWCINNDIYINVEKTKTMFFGSKARMNKIALPEFYINNTVLQRTQAYTYLGIKLDEQLSLETHANLVVKKVSQKVFQMTKIRPLLTKKAALLVYKNMILPILEYGDIFLHSASQKIRKKLQTLQNKALKCALE